MIFTSEKPNEDFTTGKRNISRPSGNLVTLLLLLPDHVRTTGHNIKWDHFDGRKKLTSIVKLRRPCLWRNCSQHWMSMSSVKSFYFIRKAFPLLSFDRQFLFETFHFYCRCFLFFSFPLPHCYSINRSAQLLTVILLKMYVDLYTGFKNVKFIKCMFSKCLLPPVCVTFLIKLRWSKTKSLYTHDSFKINIWTPAALRNVVVVGVATLY